MSRPNVVLTRDGAVQSVTFDGVKLPGVRAVEIINRVGEFPILRIEFIAESITTDLKPFTHTWESATTES